VLTIFFEHYGYLQRSHTKEHFNKLFNGPSPVKWTKNLRMHEYINRFRHEIANAAIPASDLLAGTSTSKVLCQRFISGLSPLLQRELKQDPQNNHEQYNDLQRIYAAALRVFDKHEMNPKLYLNEEEPQMHKPSKRRNSEDDEDDSAPKRAKHKHQQQSSSKPQSQQHQKQKGYPQRYSQSQHKHKHNSQKLSSLQKKQTSKSLRAGAPEFKPPSTGLPPILKQAKAAYEEELQTRKNNPVPAGQPFPTIKPIYNRLPKDLEEPLPVNPQRSNYKGSIHGGWLKHVYGSPRTNKLYSKCVACTASFKDLAHEGETAELTRQRHWQECDRQVF